MVLVDGELTTVTVAASCLNANDVVQHFNLDRTHPRSRSQQLTVNKYDHHVLIMHGEKAVLRK